MDYMNGAEKKCLLLKWKKIMFDVKNAFSLIFKVSSIAVRYYETRYFLKSGWDGNYTLQCLDTVKGIPCYLTQDDDYVYLYTGIPYYSGTLAISFEIEQYAGDNPWGKIEPQPAGKWIAESAVVGTLISETIDPTITYPAITLLSSWVAYQDDANSIQVRKVRDLVEVSIDLKGGTTSDYTKILRGLPMKINTDPQYLKIPAMFKDATAGIFKPCYIRLTNSAGNNFAELNIVGVTDNTELLATFVYRSMDNIVPADVATQAFSTTTAHNTIKLTLSDGQFKSGAITAADFTFTGSNAEALAAGTFTRTSDTVVTITGLTLAAASNNVATIKAATQVFPSRSVAVVAS